MKRKVSSILTAIAVAATVFLSSSAAFAVEDPAGVVRSEQNHDGKFASDLPCGTITIDTSEMKPTNPNFSWSSTNGDIHFDTTNERTKNSLVWAPNGLDDLTSTTLNENEKGTKTSVDGTVTLVWQGIATLQDNSQADVTMTISDLIFDAPYKVIRDAEENVIGREKVAVSGPITFFQRNGYLGPLLEAGKNVGMTAKVNVTITKNGAPVAGTVLFSTVDLDVADPYYTDEEYRESFRIDGGSLSQACIPDDNKLVITGEGSATSADGVKFTSHGTDNGTYKTGFVVLADAQQGISLTWWGQGNGMGTGLFTGNISHHITSSTTKGGTIKTTSSGTIGTGTDIGPGLVDVPDGKNQSYLMEPEEGFELGKIYIDGKEIDPQNKSTWPDFIEVTEDANGNPIVTFKENAANHTIDVTWDPIATATSGEGGSISDPGDTVIPGEPVLGPDNVPQRNADGSIKTTPGKKRYTFTPEDGYTIGKVTVDGQEVAPVFDDTTGTWYYDLDAVTDPTKIHVDWKKAYTVTFTDGDHGKSDGKGNETDVPEGSNPKGGNGVTPDTGWVFSGTYKYVITKDDGTTEEGETDDPTSIPVTGDIVFTPVYDPIVTATSGEGGKISDPGDTPVENGSSKTYTFTPEPGYEPDVVTVNGVEVTPVDNGDGTWSYTLENVTEPTTIDVQWKKKQITVTYIDPFTGEPVEIQKDAIDIDAEEPPAPADPSHDGYDFAGWDRTVDENGNITYTAKWTPQQYTIKYDANGGKGTMEDQQFTGADKAAVTKKNAFTREGYEFVGFKAKDANGNYLKDAEGKELLFKEETDLLSYLKAMGNGAEITLEAQWKKLTPIKALVKKVLKNAPVTGDETDLLLYMVSLASGLAVLFGVISIARSRKSRR